MLDFTRAITVVEKCIRETAGLNPPSAFPFTGQAVLLRLGIDNNGLIDTLKGHIADNKAIGLPSLSTPFKIDERLLTFDETSTVNDVVDQVQNNAVRARAPRVKILG